MKETLRSWYSRGFHQLRVDIHIHMRSKNTHKANEQMNGNQCGVNETLAREKLMYLVNITPLKQRYDNIITKNK